MRRIGDDGGHGPPQRIRLCLASSSPSRIGGNRDICDNQGGITCGAIEDPRKSSKAIDERVIINFCDKNVVIAHFRDKNVVIARFCDKNVVIIRFSNKNGGFILFIYIYVVSIAFSDLSIAIFFYR